MNRAHTQYITQPCCGEQNQNALEHLGYAGLTDIYEQFVYDDGQQQDINQVDEARSVEYIPQNRGYLFPNRVQDTSSHL